MQQPEYGNASHSDSLSHSSGAAAVLVFAESPALRPPRPQAHSLAVLRVPALKPQ